MAKAKVTRKVSRKGTTRRPATRRKASGRSWWPKLDFLDHLPISEKFVDRAVMISTIGLVSVGLLALGWYSGVPGYVGTQVAQAVGRAGFAVKRVEVTGIERMDRLTVYAIALDQHSMAMPLVDLDKVRANLLRFGWIEDARVSRRLPDTLVVDIVERKPAAIWQNNRKLSLIDAKGFVLERVNPDATPNLPLIVGHHANREAAAFSRLMDRVPSLRPRLKSATWVGERRWDIEFESGEVLALPEGEERSQAALTEFARLDAVERLLRRGFVRFDMRNPDRMVVRIRKDEKTERPETKPAVGGSQEGRQG